MPTILEWGCELSADGWWRVCLGSPVNLLMCDRRNALYTPEMPQFKNLSPIL
jgi:hypothetical protein